MQAPKTTNGSIKPSSHKNNAHKKGEKLAALCDLASTELESLSLSDSKTRSGKMIPLEEGWTTVYKQGIAPMQEMIRQQAASGTREELLFPREQAVDIYTHIFLMCNQPDPCNWSKELYYRVEMTTEDHINEHVLPRLESKLGKKKTDPSKFLTTFLDTYDDFAFFERSMNSWFRSLDQVYTEPNNLPSLEETIIRAFERLVFRVYEPHLMQSILEFIEIDRHGSKKELDISLVIDAVQVYENMDSEETDYSQQLEQQMLEDSRAYYQLQRHDWRFLDARDYHVNAFDAIEEERLRHDDYLHAISSEPSRLNCIVLEELLEKAPTATRNEEDAAAKPQTSCASFLPMACFFGGRGDKAAKSKEGQESGKAGNKGAFPNKLNGKRNASRSKKKH